MIKSAFNIILAFSVIGFLAWLNLKDDFKPVHYADSYRPAGEIAYLDPLPDPIVLTDPIHRVYLYDMWAESDPRMRNNDTVSRYSPAEAD